MTDLHRYECIVIAQAFITRYLDGKITDMECLAGIRKIKSVYDMLNRENHDFH